MLENGEIDSVYVCVCMCELISQFRFEQFIILICWMCRMGWMGWMGRMFNLFKTFNNSNTPLSISFCCWIFFKCSIPIHKMGNHIANHTLTHGPTQIIADFRLNSRWTTSETVLPKNANNNYINKTMRQQWGQSGQKIDLVRQAN